MAIEVLTKVYKPSSNVGPVYAKAYGSVAALAPIGNVMELALEVDEDVQEQEDMTALGGGTHAEIRRVKKVKFKAKLADVNVINLARSILGTVSGIDAGNIQAEAFTVASLGTLLPLRHIGSTDVVVKKGADAASAVEVPADGNYVARPEGIFLLDSATAITNQDKLWVDYSYGDYALIEALTTKAPELQMLYGGLNEADSGNPVVVDMWRCSQGVTKQLTLINKGFGALDVEGTLLQDPTKVGVGVSKYFRARMV